MEVMSSFMSKSSVFILAESTLLGSKSHVDDTILLAALKSVRVLGMVNVLELCQYHLLGVQSTDDMYRSIGDMGFDPQEHASNMEWLLRLNEDGIKELQGILGCILEAIDQKQSEILNEFNPAKKIRCEVEIATIGSVKLFADRGEIKFKPNSWFGLEKPITLFGLRDFLGMCTEMSALSFRNYDLRNIVLRDVKSDNLDLVGADLRGGDFSGAKLIDVIINPRTQIDNTTNFNGAQISLHIDLQGWTQQRLNFHLNHLGNADNKSSLQVINNIRDSDLNHEDKVQKVVLMQQIIHSFGDVDTTRIHDSLMDIFMSNPIYYQDEKIARFIKDKILSPKIALANKSRLDICGTSRLQLLVDIVTEIEDKNEGDGKLGHFMLKNSFFFNQLIAICSASDDQKLQADALSLMNKYLQLPQLSANKVKDLQAREGTFDEQGRLIAIDDEDLVFVLLAYDKNTGEQKALLLSRKQIHDMQDNNSDHDWSNLYLVIDGKGVPVEKKHTKRLEKIFTIDFPMFKSAYEFQQHKSRFNKLFDAINLNYVNVENDRQKPPSKDYRPLFLQALNEKDSKVKLTEPDDVGRLTEIFRQAFVANEQCAKNAKLSEELFTKIKHAFNLADSEPCFLARTLLCLAALVLKLSGVTYFGAEGHSVYPLRVFAMALINKAGEVSAESFEGVDLNGFIENIAGNNCSNLLSNDLLKIINSNPALKAIWMTLKPFCW